MTATPIRVNVVICPPATAEDALHWPPSTQEDAEYQATAQDADSPFTYLVWTSTRSERLRRAHDDVATYHAQTRRWRSCPQPAG